MTTHDTPQVLVNILNYKTERYLASCVRAMERQTYKNISLMITDNASPGLGCDFIRKSFPDIRLRCNRSNLGFARAHNEVIAEGGFDHYMPLNPDVEPEPDFVEMMVAAVQSDAQIGGVNGRLKFMTDDGRKTDFVYSAGQECNRARRPSDRGYRRRDGPEFANRAWVLGVNGAAPLYPRGFLEAVKTKSGYLDSDFFMYGEDFDLGWRGTLMGFKFLYEPRAVAYHRGFGSGGMGVPTIQRQYERNRWLTVYKNEGGSSLMRDLPHILAHELVALAFYSLTQPGRVREYLGAIAELPAAARAKAAERRDIRARTRIAPSELRHFFTAPWFTTLIRRQFGHKVVPADNCLQGFSSDTRPSKVV
jgi:GT2 family glycosyltransferase